MNRETTIHIELCRYTSLKYPKALFHSDTGSGVRLPKGIARIMSRLRKKRGHGDYVIYDPKGGSVGLMLELKAENVTVYKKDGSLRKDRHLEEQAQYLQDMRDRGWRAEFAIGLDNAIRLVDQYMTS